MQVNIILYDKRKWGISKERHILHKQISILNILLLLIFTAPHSIAQTRPQFNFVISKWTQDQGLPQNSVNDIVQTKDGYIWLATFGGLARFDGVKFTVFNKFNSPGLASDRIIGLFEDNKGGLWISSENALSYYKNGSFKTFTKDEGFSAHTGVKTLQDKKGVVWLFAFPEIYKFIDEHFYKQEIIDDKNLLDKAYMGEADFFVSFENKIFAVIDGKVINYFTNYEYPQSYFWNVVEYPKGTIWASTNYFGLYKLTRNKVQRYTTTDGLLSDTLYDAYLDQEGAIWVPGPAGLNYIQDDKIYSVAGGQSIPDVENKVIIQDQERNYWVGTKSSGVFQLRKTIISNYGEKEGLQNAQILSVCNRADGSLLVGTNGGGIFETA